MKIYVGNMPFDTTEDQLKDLFVTYGEVSSVNIISDRNTGRPKGFGFIEMDNDDEAKAAIEGLNAKDFNGRTLNVNEARPRENRPGGGRRERW